jgi:hypothetical protein
MMAPLAFATAVCVLWFVASWFDDDANVMAFVLAIVFGLLCWRETWDDVKAENAARDAQKAAEQLARETPRVIREADGCKVYQFEAAGHQRFFTRCPDSKVETHWQRTESCGKNCSRTISESIDTVAP